MLNTAWATVKGNGRERWLELYFEKFFAATGVQEDVEIVGWM